MRNTYFLALFVFVIVGCTSQKKLSYFNKLTEAAADSINQKRTFQNEVHIKVGDSFIITVADKDPEVVAIFNLPLVAYSSPGVSSYYGVQSQQYYTVSPDGSIEFPVLGKLNVVGMTRMELTNELTERIKEYSQNPIVTVKFLNLTVSVLGEVARPGNYSVNDERTTLLDVLGMAGDLTPYGRRDNILIKRENNGKIQFARINLNNVELFNSPFYYLQQNDMIYVQPNSVRSLSSQNIPLFLSSISTLATLITLIYSISQTSSN